MKHAIVGAPLETIFSEIGEQLPVSLIRRTLIDAVILLVVIAIVYPLVVMFVIKPQNPLEAAPFTMGYVDLNRVFTTSDHGSKQYAALQKLIREQSASIQEQSRKTETLRKEINHLLSQGKAAAAQQKMSAYQQNEAALNALQQKATALIQAAQSEVDRNFITQLRMATDQVREEEQLTVIHAIEPTKTLSYEPKLDVTEKVLQKFNQLYPATPASSEIKLNQKASQ